MGPSIFNRNHLSSFLIAGGVAGTTVDVSLYPIDTIKTRIQSAQGFRAAGGFRGVYAGVGSAIVGSAPGAALFFIVYEGTKLLFLNESVKTFDHTVNTFSVRDSGVHMIASSFGEVAACAVRVPTEVVKQRAQALHYPSSYSALVAILGLRSKHGQLQVLNELYRGWNITLLRELPFTVIQFPIWEALKAWDRKSSESNFNSATKSAVFGALSGAIAAAATTPLDVLKTRTMLSYEQHTLRQLSFQLWREAGIRVFFSGIIPRVSWISAGGAIFLGSYQLALNALQAQPHQQS